MNLPLRSVETPAMILPPVTDGAIRSYDVVAVGNSGFAVGSYDATEVTQRVTESHRMHRVAVADDPLLVCEFVSPRILMGDFIRAVQASRTPGDDRLQSSVAVDPTLSFIRATATWRRWMSNAGVGSPERAYVYQTCFTATGTGRATQTGREALWLVGLDQKISAFAARAGGRVTEATANRAKAVLRQFPADLPGPQVVPSVDGDVLFIWYNRGDHVEVNVDPDGYTTWFGKFSGAYEPGGDILGNADLPFSLQEMLRRLHR